MGSLALMFTACDKAAEQTYTPAAPVVTPPAYFAMDYDSNIYLEENQTSFTVPVYRAEAGAEATVAINCQVDGDFFSYKNAEGQEVEFTVNEGKATAEIPVKFAAGQDSTSIEISYPWDTMSTKAGVKYNFQFASTGESSPYFITDVDYVACYVPWVTVTGPNGETTATYKDKAIFSGFQFTNPSTEELFAWEVEIQSTEVFPGLYRIINPYEGALQEDSDDGSYTYHGTGTIYMYINATDPENVYLSDKVGNPLPEFNTYYTFAAEYGESVYYFDRIAGGLAGKYLYDDEDSFPNDGAGLGTRVDFEQGGQTYVDYIDFAEDHFFVYTDGYETTSNELIIIFPGGQGKREWNDLGMATYTEDMLSAYYEMGEQTYQVPVQQNIDNPSVYRMINPYTNYWPESNPQEEDYNITIDCSDPDFVIVATQNTGNWLESDEMYEAWMTNAAYYYTTLVTDKYKKTQAEITAAGMNDTFKDGVIEIKNAFALAIDEDDKIDGAESFSCADFGATGCKLVLPTEKAATESYATSAASNKGKKTSNAPLKFVKLFGLNPTK